MTPMVRERISSKRRRSSATFSRSARSSAFTSSMVRARS
jgi:hypothetical protein